ncbi:unnamed protein product [Nezara viridula]|uniref:Uncharacterized protein n=1 Tax=Nezara viridula TaxID=85310 RepID=A0A9P0HCE4_NEZVI|nr:unnamed protein product [Nezara viridula]
MKCSISLSPSSPWLTQLPSAAWLEAPHSIFWSPAGTSFGSPDREIWVCGVGVDHCCTVGMQTQLSYYSRRQFLEAHNQTLAHMSSILKNRAIKFDGESDIILL